jgi:hypothetical protein
MRDWSVSFDRSNADVGKSAGMGGEGEGRRSEGVRGVEAMCERIAR